MTEKLNYKILNVNTGEVLYLLFFGSILFAKGIGFYDGQVIFKLVLVFAAACLAIKMATEKYTTEEFLKILCVIVLCGVTYLISGEKGMLLYGMMMVGIKYVNVKRLFLTGTVLWTVAFLGVTLTSLLHMEDTVYKVHDKLGLGHIFRWSLGYPHPNVLHISYFILTVFIIYSLADKFKFKHAIWLFAGNCLIFLYSVSYTGFIAFMCLLAGRVYLLIRKKLGFWDKLVLQMIFPLSVLLSLLVPVTIDPEGKAFKLLNKIFSQRVELGWLYLREENISLWGRRLSEIISSSKTMDNSYLFAFITYGVIPFIFLCAATMYMIYRYLKEERYLETLIIISIVIGGITEPFLYNTSFKNLSFVFMGDLLFRNEKGKKEWSLIPWQKFPIKNMFQLQMKIPISNIKILKATKRKKYLAGTLGAVFLLLAVNLFVPYPVGYVVYRADCSSISETKTYYEEGNEEYTGYKEMHRFNEGDEVEYFNGNIVLMEQVRNNVCAVILGFMAGYLLVGGIEYYKK